MDYSTWLKLVTFDLAKAGKRTITWASAQIVAYEGINGGLMSSFLLDTEVVAQEVLTFARAAEAKKKIEDDKKHKEAEAEFAKTIKILLKESKSDMRNDVLEPESLEYQLGISIGYYILAKYLPTLSIDGLRTNNVIEVSEEEAIENKRLDDLYFDMSMSRRNNTGSIDEETMGLFNKWREHSKILEDKYLPNILECRVHRLSSINKIDDFIKGLESVLWDCDCSHYGTKDIEIVNSTYGTIIKLKRG